jgi:hypothetical protein
MATHRGYLGKLDGSEKSGTSTPYFANVSSEVVFHEVREKGERGVKERKKERKKLSFLIHFPNPTTTDYSNAYSS